MFLNSFAAWSAVLKGKLCSVRTSKKGGTAFTIFWSGFGVAELGPKSINLRCRYAASKYLCFEVPLSCIYWYCFLLHVLPHTVLRAKPKPVQDFWMNLKLESLNFTQYIFFFDGGGSELSPTFFEMPSFFFSRYQFYLVIIRKLGLNENKI